MSYVQQIVTRSPESAAGLERRWIAEVASRYPGCGILQERNSVAKITTVFAEGPKEIPAALSILHNNIVTLVEIKTEPKKSNSYNNPLGNFVAKSTEALARALRQWFLAAVPDSGIDTSEIPEVSATESPVWL